MMKRFALGCVLALLAAATSAAAEDEAAKGPAADAPQLKPLDHYSGKWDTEVTVKKPDGTDAAPAKGASEAHWVLDGWFSRQTWSVEAGSGSPALKGESVRTFDPVKQKYREFSFHANGFITESTGKWDEKSKTFTWESSTPELGWTTVTTSKFAEDGREEFTILTKNKEGKEVVNVRGVATRRTE